VGILVFDAVYAIMRVFERFGRIVGAREKILGIILENALYGG
jgi:hypothetical protein